MRTGRQQRLSIKERRTISRTHEARLPRPCVRGRRARSQQIDTTILSRVLSLLLELAQDLPSLQQIDAATDHLIRTLKKQRKHPPRDARQ